MGERDTESSLLRGAYWTNFQNGRGVINSKGVFAEYGGRISMIRRRSEPPPSAAQYEFSYAAALKLTH